MNATIHYDRAFSHRLLLDMLRIRAMEEKAAELYGQTKIRGFLHLYIGEEAVAVGVMNALAPEDAVVATYREHGHALVRGVPMNSIMAEMYGKEAGCSRGRGGSMHLFDAATRFFGGNAIVGGGLPLATGLALADSMRGERRVTACFFGDGAVAEGAFHESLNMAALWNLPVLFCCENNLYAMGTAIERAQSQTDLSAKAAAYRVPVQQVDGMDVRSVYEAASAAATHIRETGGPYFLELLTYRFRPHSMFDPELYRPKSEVEAWKTRDPLITWPQVLTDAGLLTSDERDGLAAQVGAEVEAAVAYAEAAAFEDVSSLYRDVFTESTEALR
ncbi:MAG: pyruvate dehydrogenase (acetyl-transferring) E1 component subunit alpha [Nocardiaceae bacterium]|nr:pyruvate dehydrogenase (acetyl-transferring) E1 component subunit alpha [Nocardiaceae bacterium]